MVILYKREHIQVHFVVLRLIVGYLSLAFIKNNVYKIKNPPRGLPGMANFGGEGRSETNDGLWYGMSSTLLLLYLP